MTLKEAIALLDQKKHNGCDQWWIGEDGKAWCSWGTLNHSMSDFDAIAIAEKIQREGI